MTILHHGHHDHDHGHHHHHHDESEAAHAPLGEVAPGMCRLLFIDPVAGASGDMFLSALVDLGVDFEELSAQLLTLGVPGFHLHRHRVTRHTIGATKVDVHVHDEPQPHRHVGDLIAILDQSPLSAQVKHRATRVLRRLAEAESAVHRIPVEHVHLHEVGGLDCLIDIVGTCIGLEMLGVDRIVSGPVALGTGTVLCAHGRMPVPAPGTLAILQGFPVRKTNFEGEMTTPTGAALIAALAEPMVDALPMTPMRVGYGAGSKDKEQIANMLRLVLAEVRATTLPAEPHVHAHEHSH